MATRRAVRLRPATVSKTVAFDVQVPAFLPDAYHKTHARIKRLPRRVLLISGSIGVVAIGALSGYVLLSKKPAVATNGAQQTAGPLTGSLTKGTPEYDTVLPAGTTIESLGGWTRVSPPGRNPVFAYADHIGETRITVSQQPLPPDFKQDTTVQMEQLALGYKANQKITVDGTTAYIGTSTNGPQSVILAKGDLLILIKSSVSISNDKWTAYIQSLR